MIIGVTDPLDPNSETKDLKYELLNVIEFTSDRKRMTVIVRDEEGKIKVLMKGADSIIVARLKNQEDPLIAQTFKYLNSYASVGLRTLLIAQKELSSEEYSNWDTEFQKALCSLHNREEEIEKVTELLEYGFDLLGSTAIEDKLQD